MEEPTPEKRLAELAEELPPAPPAMALYKPFLMVDQLAYVSGHGPWMPDLTFVQGRVGEDIQLEEATKAARQTGLAILATLRSNLGSLDRIKRVVKIFGMVNCTADFHQQPLVINGCSELFAQVFGEDSGVGVRSAVGMGSLPDNIPVEIEAVFEIKEIG